MTLHLFSTSYVGMSPNGVSADGGHGKLKNPGNKRKTSLSDLYNGCFLFNHNRKYEKPPSNNFNIVNFVDEEKAMP